MPFLKPAAFREAAGKKAGEFPFNAATAFAFLIVFLFWCESAIITIAIAITVRSPSEPRRDALFRSRLRSVIHGCLRISASPVFAFAPRFSCDAPSALRSPLPHVFPVVVVAPKAPPMLGGLAVYSS